MVLQSPVAISLSPNTETDDVILALSLLFRPWTWKKGTAVLKIVEWFGNFYKTPYVFAYNSGRSALFQILQAFNIKKGDEVIIQSFTCVAVPNSILWNDATPIYCDIDEQYNLSLDELKKKVTKRTKAIVVQHTFGIPAEMDKIVAFAKKEKIIVIEDCAHALGAQYKQQLLGTWGDAAIFSFGRDKVLSSVFGGIGIISSGHPTEAKNLSLLHQDLETNSYWWIFQQLFHPVAFSIILPLYRIQIGKFLLRLLQMFHLLSFPVYPMEKKAKQPVDFPAVYPNALAILALNQLSKLSRFNASRQKIAEFYRKELNHISTITLSRDIRGAIYLRFPIKINTPLKLIQSAKKEGILLGNWYHNKIDPKGTDFTAVGYKEHSCPRAETSAQEIINLPTRITLNQARSIVNMIKYSV